jgi:signal-transduction protein with cAMP-binding, CBS, and nucleotidyltransferase domain
VEKLYREMGREFKISYLLHSMESIIWGSNKELIQRVLDNNKKEWEKDKMWYWLALGSEDETY